MNSELTERFGRQIAIPQAVWSITDGRRLDLLCFQDARNVTLFFPKLESMADGARLLDLFKRQVSGARIGFEQNMRDYRRPRTVIRIPVSEFVSFCGPITPMD